MFPGACDPDARSPNKVPEKMLRFLDDAGGRDREDEQDLPGDGAHEIDAADHQKDPGAGVEVAGTLIGKPKWVFIGAARKRLNAPKESRPWCSRPPPAEERTSSGGFWPARSGGGPSYPPR